MVTTTRGTLRTDALRLLNTPQPIPVVVGRYHEPQAVRSGSVMQRVAEIRDRWRIYDRWWTETPVIRMYWELDLAGGERVTLFHDRVNDAWYRQRD